MIFVCGIHGVGKTFFCNELSKKLNINYFSASNLISKKVSNSFCNKKVKNIEFNQQILLNEVKKIKGKYNEFILDGHLCLLNNYEKIEHIDIGIIEKLGIDLLIILVEVPRIIKERISKRDGIIWSEEFISEFQNDEISYAKEVCKKLDIDYKIVYSQIFSDFKFGESIVLPIKSEYVEKILSGQKIYEYRRFLCKKNIDKIYIYETSPVKKIVAECDVLEKWSMKKEKIWNLTQEFSGISKKAFDKYYLEEKKASLYKIGNVKRYDKPFDLLDFGIGYYPQSYIYVKTK